MAEIIENDSGSGKKSGKRRPKKHSAGVDMTPMVDLMCLLITFFMLTTAFSKPKVMEITMPEQEENPEEQKDNPKVAADRTYSILLTGDDRVYWYWHKDVPEGQAAPAKLNKTDFSKDGLRKVLLQKNEKTFTEIYDLKEKVKTGELVLSDDSLNAQIRRIKKADKKAPIILIKADDKVKYKDIVNVIDEMAITNIASYAIVDILPEELLLLEAAPK